MKTKAYRHGEMLLVKVTKIPELEESKTKVFSTGSHGNNHSISSGKLFFLEKQKGQVVGYLVAKNTKLIHPEHSPKGCSIKDGKYEIRKQVEYTPSGLIPVID